MAALSPCLIAADQDRAPPGTPRSVDPSITRQADMIAQQLHRPPYAAGGLVRNIDRTIIQQRAAGAGIGGDRAAGRGDRSSDVN